MDEPEPNLSKQAIEALRRITDDGRWHTELADGDVRLVRARLPEHVVVCVARKDQGPVWIVMDSDAPDTRRHLRELLRHFPEDVDDSLTSVVLHETDLIDWEGDEED